MRGSDARGRRRGGIGAGDPAEGLERTIGNVTGRGVGKERSHLCDTHPEEVASAITHGIGAALGVAALVVMLVYSGLYGSARDIVSSCMFCGTMIAVYVISAVYHVVTEPRAKEVMQKLDRASIYLMIVGSYAPISFGVLRGSAGWWLFGAVSFMGLVGIFFTVYSFQKFRRMGVVLYVVMGWSAVAVIGKLVELMPSAALVLLVAGGVFYTSGLVFFLWAKLKFNHSLWHVFVLAGSVCHFFAFLYVLPT